MSSGIGPLTVSSGGARVSGGIGPVTASVGSRGAGAALSAGPFWLGGNAGRSGRAARGVRSRSFSRPSDESSVTPPVRRISLADHYEDYRIALQAAGVKRRNKVEMAAAAVQAVMFELAAMVAWAQPYGQVERPTVPQVPPRQEIATHVKQDMRSSGEWKWWRKHSREVLAERTTVLAGQIEAERQLLHEACVEAHAQFAQLEPRIAMLVMQAILADNGVPAAPVGIEDGDVLVLMTFPEQEELIWPEQANFDALPNVSVKKRTKADQKQLYKQILFRFLLATGKEVLTAHEGIRSVKVVAIDGAHTGPLAAQPVRGELTLDRSDLLNLHVSSGVTDRFDQVRHLWESHGSDMDLHDVTLVFSRAADLWVTLRQAESDQLVELGARVRGYETKSGALSDMGELQNLFPDVDFEALESRDGPQGAGGDIAVTQLSVREPRFWSDALELADGWS